VAIPSLFLTPGRRQALGATLGQDCIAKMKPLLDRSAQAEHAFVLDLTGVTDVNGSFLKATVFWALQCGQADVRRTTSDNLTPWAIRPLKLFPAVTGCSGEVVDEIADFFSGRSLPIMHLEKTSSGKRVTQLILGTLDPVLDRTLSALISLGEGTASNLATRSNETISISGWSNRLADLHLLRLATRQRQGKYFIYKSAADAISLWD
jgi:hypothetical protein